MLVVESMISLDITSGMEHRPSAKVGAMIVESGTFSNMLEAGVADHRYTSMQRLWPKIPNLKPEAS